MSAPVSGVIVPSSNTVLEPGLARIRNDRADPLVIVHARVRVTVIDDDRRTSTQFDGSPMADAAELLADARPSGIVWGGTSGGWLGVDADSRIVSEIERRARVPATTTTLAIIDLLRELGVDRIGLATPYVPAICSRIEDVYRDLGFGAVRCLGAGLTENHAFADVSTKTVIEQSERLVAGGAEAIVVSCTNVDALEAVGSIAGLGAIPVDSVVATYWAALRFACIPTAPGSAWLPRRSEERS